MATTLAKHEHRSVIEPYGHANLGFTPKELARLGAKAGLEVVHCDVVAREKRPPHFEVVSLLARKS